MLQCSLSLGAMRPLHVALDSVPPVNLHSGLYTRPLISGAPVLFEAGARQVVEKLLTGHAGSSFRISWRLICQATLVRAGRIVPTARRYDPMARSMLRNNCSILMP